MIKGILSFYSLKKLIFLGYNKGRITVISIHYQFILKYNLRKSVLILSKAWYQNGIFNMCYIFVGMGKAGYLTHPT